MHTVTANDPIKNQYLLSIPANTLTVLSRIIILSLLSGLSSFQPCGTLDIVPVAVAALAHNIDMGTLVLLLLLPLLPYYYHHH